MKKYSTFITESSKTPYILYHGTDEYFADFDYSKIGSNTGLAWYGYGFYFTDNKKSAKRYGSNIITAEVDINKPFLFDKNSKDKYIEKDGLLYMLLNLNIDIEYKDYLISDICNIIETLNTEYLNIDKHISQSELSPWQYELHYEYSDKYYTIRSLHETEISNDKNIKDKIIRDILISKYNIILPTLLSDIISPFKFSELLEEKGYDAIIAKSSDLFTTGKEYVIFDKNKIKFL